MHGIPLEILRLILSNLAQYEYYERFPTLTRASKRGILSARVVWGSLRTQNPLRQLFVTALEDTPFVVSGPEDDRGWISGLNELSRSEYACDMTSLSFCPMVFVDGQLRAEEWPDNTLTVLSDAISVLPALKHLRYFTVPPAHLKDAWCDKPYCKTCAQHYPPKRTPRNASATPKRCLQPGSQAAVCFSRLQICLDYNRLESLSMPYCGNRAAFCSIPWSYMTITCPGFATSLRRVSINIMVRLAMQSVFDDWIYRCPNLEFLEIALCRPPEFEFKHAHSQLFWNAGTSRLEGDEVPPRLREIRVLADTSFVIDTRDVAPSLHQFPALKRFAMANAMFRNIDWRVFFRDLQTGGYWRSDLDVVWLLNPLHSSSCRPGAIFERYVDNAVTADLVASGVAKEIKIVHVPFPWGEEIEVRLGVGRDHSYPGFEGFDEDW